MGQPIVVAGAGHPELAKLLDGCSVWASPRNAARLGLAAAPLAEIPVFLDALAAARGVGARTAVVASGDPGFFGVVRVLAARFGREALHVHPAPSSVSLAFARLGLPWDDAVVVSMHGRPAAPVGPILARSGKVAILTAPGVPPASFAGAVSPGVSAAVFSCLGEAGETGAAGGAEVLQRDWPDPNVVVLWREPGVGPKGRTWGLPESCYEHRAGMITKSEVRAVVLARLGPAPGCVCWDVGSGSGSVAAEAAALGATVWAVERDAVSADGIRARAAPDVTVVQGSAPAALDALPDPHVAFVGGGGEAVVDAVAARRPQRLVLTLARIDRLAAVDGLLRSHDYSVDSALVSVSRVRPIAGGHRLEAENPVLVVAGEKL